MAATTTGRKIETGINIIIGLIVLALIVIVGLPLIKVPVLGDLPLLPTAIVRSTSAPRATPIGSDAGAKAVPTMAQAQIEATSRAIYEATAQASLVLPNTGQSDAPAILVQRPAEERQPAGDNVPTAEPVVQAESGGIFGTKPVLVNPQETHECKHGQVWVENKGCKNP